MRKKTRHIGRQIRKYIHEIDPKTDVILFGSRARGEEGKESDWDILILTDYPVNAEKERIFRNKLYELELDTGEVFSVFVYSKKEWNTKHRISPFYQQISQEGIRI